MEDLDRLAPRHGGVRLLPVFHERVEMAAVARAVLDRLDPAGVAVELPTTLAAASLQAVRRLPRVSLLLAEEPGEDVLVWVVAPGDPLAEAQRWALERGRQVFFIDPDVPYPERHRDPLPDPWAVFSLGPARFLQLLAEQAGRGPVGEADRRREEGMAYHLRRARERLPEGELLGLVGAAHTRRVGEALAAPLAAPFARVRRQSVELRHLAPRALTGLLPDAPLAHAAWERLRTGETPAAPALEETLSRRVSVIRYGLRVITGEGDREGRQRGRHRVDYAAAAGSSPLAGRPAPDRERLTRVVWETGTGSHLEQTGEASEPWQRRLYLDFARRYARVQGGLVPGLWEWVVAARGVGDDNLAWEVFDAARTYPWQEEEAELPTADLDGSELDLGTRKVRFRRRFFRVKRRPVAVPVRRRPEPDEAGEWLEALDATGLCSYPPEDLVVEDYGRHLQRRALSVLSSRNRRSEPFVAGMLDGVDVRETLRNLHDGRVWVQEEGRLPGEAGSVVVIFAPDPEDREFPFRMTWLGENDQESDMAFYSTDPAEQLVGPGILRATYGGFLLTSPPGRLFDVWQDPEYRFTRSKEEVLLRAGVDYSRERIVVHLGPSPPGSRMHAYAAAQRKQLVHLPLGSLSPAVARKIRVVHLLSGRDKREVAPDYIW